MSGNNKTNLDVDQKRKQKQQPNKDQGRKGLFKHRGG